MLNSITVRRASAVAVCAILAGCASPKPIAYTGLASSPELRPAADDESGHFPYRYSTDVKWQNYDKVIIDPVVIYRGADHQFGDMSDADKTTLATYMQAQFTASLAKRFLFTSTPDRHTLRIRLSLTGAAATTQVVGTFTHIDIAGNLYNGVQAVRGGEGLIAGSVTYSVEIYDAASARLLAAYISKQYPGALNIGASFGSLAAAKTGLDKGADALVAQLR